MPFVHEVRFDIPDARAGDLRMGASLQRVIGYLRSTLPDGEGYIESRAMHSVDRPGSVQVVVQSVWEDWDDLESHRMTGIAEEKILVEFGGFVSGNGLAVRSFEELP